MTISVERVPHEIRPLWQYLFGIIDRPVSTFEAVLTQRKWLTWAVPLFIVIIAFAITTGAQTPHTLALAREQAERQLASMPAQQAEAAQAMMETTLSLPFMLATGLGVGIITLLAGVLIQAAFLYFGSLIVGGNDTTFGSMFTMTAWARLPMAIGYLVYAGLIFASQEFIYPGLAFLVTTGDFIQDTQNPLVSLLGSIDLFWLWHLLLIVLGLSVVSRLSRGKSLVLTGLYAALSIGVVMLPSLIFGGGFGS
jgi:hypothetical protein